MKGSGFLVKISFYLINGQKINRKVEQLDDYSSANLNNVADVFIEKFENWMEGEKDAFRKKPA